MKASRSLTVLLPYIEITNSTPQHHREMYSSALILPSFTERSNFFTVLQAYTTHLLLRTETVFPEKLINCRMLIQNSSTQFALHLFKYHTQLAHCTGPPSAIRIYLGDKKSPILHNLRGQTVV
jgi:hypothetical protein